jgi:Putative ATP-dependent Lon protease
MWTYSTSGGSVTFSAHCQPRCVPTPLSWTASHAYLPGWDLPKVSRDLLTNHFGLVSDFLSECWNQLRRQSRQNLFQGRIHLGGALSGRDTTGVQKTVSGLIKLVSSTPETPVPDEVLEWALRIALECLPTGQGTRKSASVPPSFVTPNSGTRQGGRGGEVCRHARALQRKQHWQRSSAAGTGLGYFARRRRLQPGIVPGQHR